jgi:hypothetical protein
MTLQKLFADEIAKVDETLEWARTAPVGPLEAFVTEAAGLPLLAIGSGGSMTAAHFAALLHRHRFGAFARPSTPLEVLLSEPGLARSAALLLSASGKNADILAVIQACIASQLPAVATLCTRRGSPLAAAARGYLRGRVFEEDLPAGEDGLLATNSVLATAIILARAYGSELPPRFSDRSQIDGIGEAFSGERRICLILYGGWGAPAAADFESKLNETALVAPQVSDYRGLGHGRQLWLARPPKDVVVLAIVTPEVEDLAARTLALIPQDIPIVQLRTRLSGPAGAIDLLVKTLDAFAGIAGAHGIDPMSANMPEFCFRIYRLAP